MIKRIDWDMIKDMAGDVSAAVDEIAEQVEAAETDEDARAALDELAGAAKKLADLSSDCASIAAYAADREPLAELLDMVQPLVYLVNHLAGAIEKARGKYEGGTALLGWLECTRDDLEYLTDVANRTIAKTENKD